MALSGRALTAAILAPFRRMLRGACRLIEAWYVPFMVGFALIASGVVLWAYFSGHIVVFPEKQDHIALLSVFMGLATLILTGVAVIVGVAAVAGLAVIKEVSVDAARKAGAEAGQKQAQDLLNPMALRLEEALKRLEEQSLGAVGDGVSRDSSDKITKALAKGEGNDDGAA